MHQFAIAMLPALIIAAGMICNSAMGHHGEE